MTNTETVTTELLRQIIDGCEGVTPGPWFMYGEPDVGLAPEPFSGSIGKGDMEPVYRDSRNLQHIARLDPATVKAMAELALEALASRTQSPDGVAPTFSLTDQSGNVIYSHPTSTLHTSPTPKHSKEETGVRVKPLEWGPYPNAALAGPDVDVASFDTFGDMFYQVQRDPWAPGFMALLAPKHGTLFWKSKDHTTIEAAKAAAQTDYEQRILSALHKEGEADYRHQCASSGFHDHDGCSCSEEELRARFAVPVPVTITDAARDVLAERKRQVEAEGWTPEHDEQHYRGELAQAAATYAFVAGLNDYDRTLLATGSSHVAFEARNLWPRNWDGWFKPKDRRRDLVRAGALVLAAIERLDRAALSQKPGEQG